VLWGGQQGGVIQRLLALVPPAMRESFLTTNFGCALVGLQVQAPQCVLEEPV